MAPSQTYARNLLMINNLNCDTIKIAILLNGPSFNFSSHV